MLNLNYSPDNKECRCRSVAVSVAELFAPATMRNTIEYLAVAGASQ